MPPATGLLRASTDLASALERVGKELEMILIRHCERQGLSERTVRKAATRGELLRVAPGVYCSSTAWAAADSKDRQLALITAHRDRRSDAVYSHFSAAALLNLVVIGGFPEAIHVRSGSPSGGNRRPSIIVHSGRLSSDDVVEVNGILVTSAARTAADLGTAVGFRRATATADSGLSAELATAGHYEGLATRLDGLPNSRSATKTLRFADSRSDSPGESMSRALIHELGFIAPDLQVAHPHDGGVDYVDFEWRDHKIIGEFDGRVKYQRLEYLGSLSPAEAVFKEKVREDRLRSEPNSMVRWIWADLMAPHLLEAKLTRAGVPRRR